MIFGMVAVTWGVRSAPLVMKNLNLSPTVLNFLNCVPAAVLAALIAEPVLAPVMQARSVLQPELLATAICITLGVCRVPMLLTVLLGMSSYWLLRYWLA